MQSDPTSGRNPAYICVGDFGNPQVGALRPPREITDAKTVSNKSLFARKLKVFVCTFMYFDSFTCDIHEIFTDAKCFNQLHRPHKSRIAPAIECGVAFENTRIRRTRLRQRGSPHDHSATAIEDLDGKHRRGIDVRRRLGFSQAHQGLPSRRVRAVAHDPSVAPKALVVSLTRIRASAASQPRSTDSPEEGLQPLVYPAALAPGFEEALQARPCRGPLRSGAGGG